METNQGGERSKLKFKLAGLMGLFLVLAWSIQPLNAATQLKKMGGNPFHKAKGLKAETVYPTLPACKGM